MSEASDNTVCYIDNPRSCRVVSSYDTGKLCIKCRDLCPGRIPYNYNPTGEKTTFNTPCNTKSLTNEKTKHA